MFVLAGAVAEVLKRESPSGNNKQCNNWGYEKGSSELTEEVVVHFSPGFHL
jgi:hypothetical protein